MITRIEIDGFKTFQDFAVDLTPFQVIIGPNGSGKSNFFDALHLLSSTANQNLYAGFRSLRGEQREHFTVQTDGRPSGKMRLKVEMLVPAVVKDEWGQEVQLANPRLRYELEIRQHQDDYSTEWLFINHESLRSIPIKEDAWLSRYSMLMDNPMFTSSGEEEYICTIPDQNNNRDIRLLEDTTGTSPHVKQYSSQSLQATVLSSVRDCATPHALAARQDLQRWQFESISTEVMRMSPNLGFPNTPVEYITGNLIPQILARLKSENPREFNSVSRDMANLVPGLQSIDVEAEIEGRTTVYAIMRDKRRFSIRLLSDGTLRFLALATLRNDPQRRGISGGLCFEDPETGVHPSTLKRIVRLLRGMATDLNDPEDLKLPLRQVLVTTHSPELVSHLNIEQGELLLADMAMRVEPGVSMAQVTRMTSVHPDNAQSRDNSYTLARVIEYLSNSDVESKRESLQEALVR